MTQVKAKKITEIHAEAEQNLGLRPGMASLRNGRGPPGIMGMPLLGGNIRPGRMMPGMPGMPGLLPGSGKMPGALPLVPDFPIGDSEGWETYTASRKNKIPKEGWIPAPSVVPNRPLMPALGPRPAGTSSKLLPTGSGGTFLGRPSALLGDAGASRPVPTLIPTRQNVGVLEQLNQGRAEREKIIEQVSKPAAPAPAGLSPAVLQRKSESLLKEFISVGDLKEAKLCVEELQSPDFHSQLVQMAITILLESLEGTIGGERDLVKKLFVHLWVEKVLSSKDIKARNILGILLGS